MADVIRLFPESVANQIAAGEVVQRPASAAKELIENAIDAGATRLEIIIEDAGKTLLQVIDNGSGMSETDARMAFERHATSKISKAADLGSIRSFGFRGEALASIAAVSRVEMRTRIADRDLGTHIIVEATHVKSQDPVAMPVGTNIAMRNLFFNTPARRNFLKSDPVELKHILEEVHRMALAYPAVHFIVFNQGKELMHLTSGSLQHRIAQLWKKKSLERFLPIDQDMGDVQIRGYISKLDYSRKTRGEQYFFVNNRFIKSGYLHHALMTAYADLIPDGQYPSYVLFITVDPSEIDINVHPTKHEIKFQDERIMYRYINVAVRHVIGKFTVGSELPFDAEAETRVGQSVAGFSRSDGPKQHASNNLSEWRKAFEGIDQFSIPQQEENSSPSELFKEQAEVVSSTLQVESSAATGIGAVVSIGKKYLATSLSSGLVLIDQRAAHERILYESFQEKQGRNAVNSQVLLFPLTLRWSAQESVVLNDRLELLRGLGFDIEPFSAESGHMSTFILRAVPDGLQESLAESVIQTILSEDVPDDTLQDYALLSVVRSMAVSRNTYLQPEERTDLVARLLQCADPVRRPGGGKTFVEWSRTDLDKLFN